MIRTNRSRFLHALPFALVLAMIASQAGCGDNRDCVGDECNLTNEELCDATGDEDGDGLADCADSDCAADPACQPQCGNGIQNIGEGCDDSNTVDTDACTNTCNRARCGDNIVWAGMEECDDANTSNEDGCTNTCRNARCGDGFVGPGEQCDDGNQVNTDTCTNTCRNAACQDGFVGPGEECDDGNNVDTDACTNACGTAICGDMIVRTGVEQCDDGNMVNTDSCTNTCQSARCGDGFVGPGEACDDGNMINTDGCTNLCRLATCGDGFVQAGEQCDDGNMVNTDGCLNTCMTATCGDMVTQAGVEQCDDGNQIDTDACRNTCINAVCGDSVVQTGVEQCDDGNMVNTDTCTNACTTARCGDMIVGPGETCDDGNMVNGDGCDNTCVASGCGNGVIGGAETCDDGNAIAGDGCSATCMTEPGFTCNMTPSMCITTCGDGIIAGAERCDQGMGNVTNGDGCSATCQLEPGFACGGTPTVCAATCGNNAVDANEQCDDANQANADGCSANCRFDIGCAAGETQIVATSGAAVPILDNMTVSSPVMVNTAGNISKLAVYVGNLTHTYDGDVTMSLTGPRTISRNLAVNLGGSSDNYVRTLFDDGAAASITTGTAPFTGRFRPAQVLVSAASGGFRGQVASGTWNLNVNDNATGDNGAINSWTLLACASTLVPRCGNGMVDAGEECDDGNDVNADLCNNTCQLVDGCGDGNIDAGEQCDDDNVTSGDGCSAMCQVDITCPVGQVAVTVANNAMTPIPDNDQVTGISSQVAVAQAGGVMSAKVLIRSLPHTATGDIDMYLVSPNGTQRELSTDNTGGNDNFVNTLFIDSAATSITAAPAGASGAFRPEQSLTTTQGVDMTRLGAAGNWTLKVFDDDAADTGSLNGWTLFMCVDPTAFCGDGVVNGGDECDDANVNNADACSNQCAVVDGCGDGNIDAGEACDDNNVIAGDGCSGLCMPDISCPVGQTPVVVTNTPASPVAIPDNNTGLLSAIPIATAGLVRRAIVTLNISHANDAHLDIYLQSPRGGQRILSDDNPSSGTGVNYVSTILSDTAAASITTGTAPFTGQFKPEQTLDGFNNQSAGGDWLLRIGDDTSTITGTLNSWTLALCVDVSAARVCGNGIVEATEQCDDGNVVSNDGCSNLCALELSCAAGQVPVVVTSADEKLLIPDNTVAGITSTIAVPGAGTVGKAMILVNSIGHTFDDDLDITVTSPMGTSVELSTDNGSSGDDYLGTILADAATRTMLSADTDSTAPPFRGMWKPEGTLSTLNTQPAAGNWVLKVVDDLGGDVGMLRTWSVGLCVAP